MSAYPVAKLGGRLLAGSAPVRWTFIDGVQPSTAVFELLKPDVETLLSGGLAPVTLEISGGVGLGTEKIDYLYVISEVPADDPNHGRVLVADRRWWWRYRHVKRDYNVRRRVGFRRVKNPSTQELQPVAEDVWYAPWSTKDEDGAHPWTAREVVEDVLAAVLKKEQESCGYLAPSDVDEQAMHVNDLPIENLNIDESGDEAVARVLRFMPEMTVGVDADGTVRVYSRLSGNEVPAITVSGPEIVGGGHVQRIDLPRPRPSAIKVLFSREVEVRYDVEELASTTSSSARDKDDRFMDNVLPVPDFELGTWCQGTWITFAEALTAWGVIPGLGRALDFDIIRQAMVAFCDLWSMAQQYGEGAPDADWMGRLAAVQQHYRQTYRINRRWRDRIHSISAYRVAVIDPESGMRAPAVAYSDYAQMGSMRAILAGGLEGGYVLNVAGSPASKDAEITDAMKPAPARVSVVDSDQGIVRLDFLTDVLHLADRTLPGTVDNAPTTNLRRARFGPIGWDSLPKGNATAVPTLATPYRMALIVTVTPGSPNGAEQLHAITVKPGDIAGLLPPAARAGLNDCRGPIMEVRVSPTPETTAKVAWMDSYREAIEKVMGVRALSKDETMPDLDPITVNAGDPLAPLDAIARAMAAAIYASLSDRPQGSKTIPLQSTIKLGGWLGSVSWEVTTKGEVLMQLRMREGGPALDMFALMPTSVRRMILRLAQPGGNA